MAGRKPRRAASVAVLPFVNMSPEPEQDYFCDGMSEEILNSLTHVPQLDVIARTSSFQFKGVAIDIRDVGNGSGPISSLKAVSERPASSCGLLCRRLRLPAVITFGPRRLVVS